MMMMMMMIGTSGTDDMRSMKRKDLENDERYRTSQYAVPLNNQDDFAAYLISFKNLN
jgi:hypothetical protein